MLMPGSRADLLVQSPAETASDVTYRLVNDNFQAGYAIGDADVWPHVALATITFKASRARVVAMQPRNGNTFFGGAGTVGADR
jgi:hypothetical protein